MMNVGQVAEVGSLGGRSKMVQEVAIIGGREFLKKKKRVKINLKLADTVLKRKPRVQLAVA